MPETRKTFVCDYCQDRGYVIEDGCPPLFEGRAEFIPCPVCRGESAPRSRGLGIAAVLFILALMAFFLV